MLILAHGDAEEWVCAGEGSLGKEDQDLCLLQREGCMGGHVESARACISSTPLAAGSILGQIFKTRSLKV